jgi:phospholipid/cholesterol/gamma-HCH transport system substrate-binding protein
VLNGGDPHPCTTGYVPTESLPDEGAVASLDPYRVSCQVVNGVDPDPGDGYDETGSSIRGEQNIGRDGGTGSGRPQGELGGGGPLTPSLGRIVDGMLHASPISTITG